MKNSGIQLTPADRLILDSYCKMMEGLSQYLGNGYELVLHSLENYEHSAIKIINGFHTGRKEGAPITDMALSMLEQIRKKEKNDSGITYFSTNSKGEPLKSTTLPIKGENERIIGLLCLNFYMNTPVSEFFQNFSSPGMSSGDGAAFAELQENFSPSSTDLLENTIRQAKEEVLMNTGISASNKNKEIISRLHSRGIFTLKDAVIITAKELDISKNTVYLHLRNLEKGIE